MKINMHKNLTLLIIVFIFTFVYITAACAEGVAEDDLLPPQARLAALGGFHPALTDDIMTIFTNPAGFRSIESEILISDITLGISGPIFNITSAFISGGDPDENTELLNELKGIYANMEVAGPVSFAYIGQGLALGLFHWTDVAFDSRGSAAMDASVISNFLLTGGYSFRIPLPARNTIDIGLQVKGFARGQTFASGTTIELFTAAIDDPLNLLYMGNFVFSIGGGIDTGILYSLGDIFSVGITARDLFTPTLRTTYDNLDVFLGEKEGTSEQTGGHVPLNLSSGVKFSPPLGYLGRFLSDVTLYLDYEDILDSVTHPETSKHWFLHLGFGVELTLLDILKFRGGFTEGLFAAGLGLNLTIFELNVAVFGKEISSEPSLRPIYNLIVSIALKL